MAEYTILFQEKSVVNFKNEEIYIGNRASSAFRRALRPPHPSSSALN